MSKNPFHKNALQKVKGRSKKTFYSALGFAAWKALKKKLGR